LSCFPAVALGGCAWRGVRPGAACFLALCLALPSAAQAPPFPDLGPDERDFGGRINVTQGSGARAFGMGGAFLGRADDATAASWNPAGLSYLREAEFSLVGVSNTVNNRVPSLSGQVDRFVGYGPDFLSVAAPVQLGKASGAVQLSFQRVFSFAGRRDVTRPDPGAIPVIFGTRATGGFDVLALGTGFQVARPLRLGITLNRWVNGYHQVRDRPGLRPLREELDFSLRGWNTNIGLLWSPWDNFNMGLAARAGFTGKVRLRRERQDSSAIPPSPENTTTNEHEASNVRLDIPGSIGIGMSWRVRSPLTVSLDYTRTAWSDGRIFNYFRVQRALPNADEPPDLLEYPLLPYPTLDDTQKDTDQVRVGVEYVLLAGRVRLPIRAGYFTDRQYFRSGSATGEAPRFNGFTAGTGVGAGSVLFDVAYLYETGTFIERGGSASTSTDFRRLFLSIIYRRGGAR